MLGWATTSSCQRWSLRYLYMLKFSVNFGFEEPNLAHSGTAVFPSVMAFKKGFSKIMSPIAFYVYLLLVLAIFRSRSFARFWLLTVHCTPSQCHLAHMLRVRLRVTSLVCASCLTFFDLCFLDQADHCTDCSFITSEPVRLVVVDFPWNHSNETTFGIWLPYQPTNINGRRDWENWARGENEESHH